MGLKKCRYHGAGSVSVEDVAAEHKRLQEVSKGWDLDRVYNEDETGLFDQYVNTPPLSLKLTYRYIQDSGLNMEARPGPKKSKKRITIHLACNVTGTDKRVPSFIGKARSPHCFHGRHPVDKNRLYFVCSSFPFTPLSKLIEIVALTLSPQLLEQHQRLQRIRVSLSVQR